MTRDIIDVQYPVVEETQSVAKTAIVETEVVAENGVTLRNAFANKNHSLFIFIENTSDKSAVVTFVSGDAYPNSILGNLDITVDSGEKVVLQLQDISRFETSDGCLNLDFSADFVGNIYAVAKSTKLNV